MCWAGVAASDPEQVRLFLNRWLDVVATFAIKLLELKRVKTSKQHVTFFVVQFRHKFILKGKKKKTTSLVIFLKLQAHRDDTDSALFKFGSTFDAPKYLVICAVKEALSILKKSSQTNILTDLQQQVGEQK